MMKKEELTVEIWHDCPNDCLFCSSKEVSKSGEKVRLNKIMDIIDKYDIQTIRWSGGEPLTKGDIIFYIKEIDERTDCKQIVNTSGVFNYSTFSNTAFERVDEIRFSVLSDRIRHNYYTNNQCYGQVIDNLIKCISKTDMLVNLTTPYLTKEDLFEVLDIALTFGVTVRVASVVLSRRALDETNIDKDVPILIIRDYLRCKYELDDEYLDILQDTCSINPSKDCRKDEKLGILPDGSTYECAVEKVGYCPKKLSPVSDNHDE